MVIEAHARYRDHAEGSVADDIPVLGRADPSLFGLVVTDAAGGSHVVGDADVAFPIQSISKLFVYALALERHGHDRLREVVGVNNTGLPFNSVMVFELNAGHPMNPMVNAGAIATTALLGDGDPGRSWEALSAGLSLFAGRELEVDREVYASEAASNDRNLALGRVLRGYGRLEGPSDEHVDAYTRQCALSVTARDIALMGATLADGGVNPVTGLRVVSEEVARDALSVAAAAGLYERSGEWLFEIGLPAKSGVAGCIVAVAPGKGAVGAFSPPLDAAGNSVRSQLAIGFLSRAMGLNLFASAVNQTPRTHPPKDAA
ncbi:glutaminase A [Galactobacter valiniphilus]|uniref:Glutaminase n=1 Tax=Galactobacter valiniphilus TaxID=2676122 RepID=A0A399J949_9MICC|nr:glutaminase A [Galactobacter valiniphilus]